MICINYILLFSLLSLSYGLSLNDIKNIFGDKDCIVGTLLTLQNEDTSSETWKNNPSVPKTFEGLTSEPAEDKSALSSIHELAQYNDINFSYELINEEGPPHNKVFTITLYLGNENYSAHGKSLKNAQRKAAQMALKNTEYQHPPLKIKKSEKSETPVALLNNLALKLGMTVQYTVVNDILEQLESKTTSPDIPEKKSYLQKLNDTVHSNDTVHVRRDDSDTKGPFKVRLNVNDVKFYGEAQTIKNARNEAAFKALNHINTNKEEFSCEAKGNCKEQKQMIKSPISIVYEAAQKRNLAVNFEIIDEFGPAHKKTFTTKCVVGDLEVTGSGKSKKESKRIAAENMLPGLMNIPEVDDKHTNSNKSKKSKNKNKKNKIVKTTFDKIDRMFDNVVDFGKSLIGKVQGTSEDDAKPNKKKGDKQIRSASEQILKLGHLLNIEVQYTEYLENEKHYAVLGLGTKPAFICLGEGVNVKNSRDLAAKYGLNVFYKLGLLDKFFEKSTDVSDILDKEVFEDLYMGDINIEEEKKHSEL
ncbi:maternal effect protein staufen-like [Rhynchophorus ferrugineus]|uniref:maternal effect protein staufen-like n=1 Tax=Rhynchophorus ferrugineus TaxID=354439 RepID=UPI003FCD1743